LNFSDAYLAKNAPSKLQWTLGSGTTAVPIATGTPLPVPNGNLQMSQWMGTLWIGSKDMSGVPGNVTLAFWPGTGASVPKGFIEDIFLVAKYTIA
jgi:hypothetical protein